MGPADLAISLGFKPGMDPEEPAVVDAIKSIVTTAKKHGKFAGLHCGSASYIKRMWDIGFDYGTLLSDGRLMTMKAEEFLSELKATSGGPKSSTY